MAYPLTTQRQAFLPTLIRRRNQLAVLLVQLFNEGFLRGLLLLSITSPASGSVDMKRPRRIVQRFSVPSMNFPTTARIPRITIKSAESMAAISSAGTHLVVQGTNKTNGT
jgi:hypothetical protein